MQIACPLNAEAVQKLSEGVDIGDEELTLPAKVQILDDSYIILTIHEGRFHQVKRMLKEVDNEVLSLKRISFGPLTLPDDLQPGEFRELTHEEVTILQKKA